MSADRLRRVDRVAVLVLRSLAAAVARHNEDLRGALEGMVQALGVIEVSLAHPNTTLAEGAGLFRIANADAKLGGGKFLEESFSDGLAKLSGGSGDNDHKLLLSCTARRRPRPFCGAGHWRSTGPPLLRSPAERDRRRIRACRHRRNWPTVPRRPDFPSCCCQSSSP